MEPQTIQTLLLVIAGAILGWMTLIIYVLVHGRRRR